MYVYMNMLCIPIVCIYIYIYIYMCIYIYIYIYIYYRFPSPDQGRPPGTSYARGIAPPSAEGPLPGRSLCEPGARSTRTRTRTRANRACAQVLDLCIYIYI